MAETTTGTFMGRIGEKMRRLIQELGESLLELLDERGSALVALSAA